MSDATVAKKCFVISPIGEDGSDTRKRSDQVFRHIIEPCANECGYIALRADQLGEPGIITNQVIQHLIGDSLVIADLSERNANVFYELAIRHVLRKPLVQIIRRGEIIPFDVAPMRIVQFDHRDLDSVADAKREIVTQIRAIERDPTNVQSPISAAVDLESLRASDRPEAQTLADLATSVAEIRSAVAELIQAQRRYNLPKGLVGKFYGGGVPGLGVDVVQRDIGDKVYIFQAKHPDKAAEWIVQDVDDPCHCQSGKLFRDCHGSVPPQN
jgi:hypothetical protein